MSALPETARGQAAPGPSASPSRRWGLVPVLLVGVYFGIVLTKGELVSWYRIQEMFRFQSFHMYGTIGSAVAVAALGLWILKMTGARTLDGSPAVIPEKPRGARWTRYWLGGTIFGLGWGILGACPGPIYTLLGAGVTTAAVALVSALAGTWVYAIVRPQLPH